MSTTGQPRDLPPQTAEDRRTFKRDLVAVVPHLRAFARTLCGCSDRADDLAGALRESFRAHAGRTAIVTVDCSIGYAELDERTSRIGAACARVTAGAARTLAAPAP